MVEWDEEVGETAEMQRRVESEKSQVVIKSGSRKGSEESDRYFCVPQCYQKEKKQKKKG